MSGKHDIARDLAIKRLKQQLANKITWNHNWRALAKQTTALNKSLVKQLAGKDAEIERLQIYVKAVQWIHLHSGGDAQITASNAIADYTLFHKRKDEP